MARVHVRVTPTLIHWALQQSNSCCAIALALQDADEDFGYVRVDQKTIRFSDLKDGRRYIFETPDALAKWIDVFDTQRAAAGPIEFDIDLAQPLSTRPMIRTQPSKLAAADQRRRAKGVTRGGPNSSFRPLRNK